MVPVTSVSVLTGITMPDNVDGDSVVVEYAWLCPAGINSSAGTCGTPGELGAA